MIIWFLQGGTKITRPSIIRAKLRIWYEKNGFSTVQKNASAYVGRDKKILKNFIFAPRPLRILLRSGAGFELALFGFVLAGIGGFEQEGQDNLRIKHASRLKKTGKMSKNT